jgi:5-formyltetrahydrofolate cyclo-ligase
VTAHSVTRRKAELRAELRAVRTAILPDQRLALGRLMQARLIELPFFREAGAVLLFYSFGSEIPTAGTIQRSLDDGKRVFLPLLEAGEMIAAELKPGDSLAASTYGPKEPSNRVEVNPAEVDLVVTPGLGFDRLGYRLGYGAAHYDRYLARLRAATPRIGIAFHQQVVAELPRDADDQRLDMLVTDQEVLTFPPRTGATGDAGRAHAGGGAEPATNDPAP